MKQNWLARSGPPTGMAVNLEVKGEDFNQMSEAVESIKEDQRHPAC